ncbi:MAG: alpha-amylase [Bacteroidaceae bacterium]|nr:alpha-amylase [Bacteroidaceae bacterium]
MKLKSFLWGLTAICLLPASLRAEAGPEWLKKAVFYQIYPSSYMDSDGNGIGDLPGITSRLDYLQSLGITALWLNPIYVSGWQDGGYDVIDFYQVDPRFGTNTDLVVLADELHKRGMKLCLDLVAGHTSDKNEWFLQSKSGKDLRYSDYYIWTDEISEDEKELIKKRYEAPDPSASTIGRFVEANAPRAKYYEKNFYESQPALNYGYANPDPNHPWEQPVTAAGPQATRQELKDIMTFWFSKGVDGFRVDLASSLVKNDPDKKEVSKLWQEMRKWRDENFADRALIAEWFNPDQSLPAGFDIDFYRIGGRPGTPGASMNLFRLNANRNFGGATQPKAYFDRAGQGEVKAFVEAFNQTYEHTKNYGYLSLPTGNHDSERMSQEPRTTQDLKVAMSFLLTLPGTPFIYYGDEIGMKQQFGLPSKEGSNARSGCRTPMQWTGEETAGFSTATPDKLYLPVNTENGKITVEAEEKDPNSLLNFVKGLLKLRAGSEALGNDGSWVYVGDKEQPYPMVYRRSSDYEDYIIAINPSGKKVKTTIHAQGASTSAIAYATGKGSYKILPKGKGDVIGLDACSAIIVKLEGCQQCDEK